jgi:pentatricopeptide repeat protein
MLRCVQLVRRAPVLMTRLVAARWNSSSTGSRGGKEQPKDPKIHAANAATHKSSSDRAGGGGRHINHHGGRGAGGRGRGSGRGAGSADELKFRQIGLMQHIQKLGNGKMWSEAVASLRKAQQQSFPVNTMIYSAAITACAKSAQWEPAVQLLRELENSDVLSPTVHSYSAASTACANAAQWQLAVQLLKELNSIEGVQANVISYSATITACANALQWKVALKLFNEMKERGIEPDNRCFDSVITACAKVAEWQTAVQLFEEAKAAGVVLDVFT